MSTIYFSAPLVTRGTARYENYYFKVSHLYPHAVILEASEMFQNTIEWNKGWQGVLKRIDVLIFIRNEQHSIGQGTFREVMEAKQAGKDVFMARMTKDGNLVLIPFSDLEIIIHKGSQRNYAKVGSVYRDGTPKAVHVEASGGIG